MYEKFGVMQDYMFISCAISTIVTFLGSAETRFCTTCILLAILGYSGYCVYQLFLHLLANLLGPRVAAITNLWKAYHTYRLHLHDTITELHLRYGPVVRIGPNDVHVQDSQAVAEIYKGGRAFPKTHFYSAFQTSTIISSAPRMKTVMLYEDDSVHMDLARSLLQRWKMFSTHN